MDSLTPVTIIGLGPMGQAMTIAFLEAGHPVTVWNRTPSRADGVVEAGARLAADPTDALGSGRIVILSLINYGAMWDILRGHERRLHGRTLVNLSSDTPTVTRDAARWAAEHGATFLTGGIMVPAPMVGTEHAYAYYSGDEASFEQHSGTLSTIGAARYLGDDAGRAQLMYQAQLDLFLTTLAGFAHATALVGTAGITAREFLPELMQLFTAIPSMIAEEGADAMGRLIDADEHPGEGSSNRMLAATADHIVATSEAVGVEPALPGVIQDLYRRTLNNGWGRQGWTRTIELLHAPRP